VRTCSTCPWEVRGEITNLSAMALFVSPSDTNSATCHSCLIRVVALPMRVPCGVFWSSSSAQATASSKERFAVVDLRVERLGAEGAAGGALAFIVVDVKVRKGDRRAARRLREGSCGPQQHRSAPVVVGRGDPCERFQAPRGGERVFHQPGEP